MSTTAPTLKTATGHSILSHNIVQGIHARLGRGTHKRNTAWTPQYEGSVSEVWAYVLKRRRAIVACNIVTHELIQFGSFNHLTVA
jgi:hypothetical protein